MAYETATGTINIGTGVLGTQYSVTGQTGTWKALILWWSGRSETIDASGEGNINPGIGFAVSATSRRAVTVQSEHAQPTTDTDSYHSDAAVVALLDIDGTVSALADFVSFNPDGFTLVVDDAFPAALEVSYLLLGGADLTEAEILTFTTNAVTGSQDITSGTFQGDFALFITTGRSAAPPSGGATWILSLGAATASSQAVHSTGAVSGSGNSATHSYCRAGEIYAAMTAPGGVATVIERVSFTRFLSNGFRISVDEITAATYIFALVLKGGSYGVGNFLTATDTNNFDETVGFTPKAAMFFSANRAESAIDTATDHAEWSVGAATSPTARSAQYVRDKDGVTTSDAFSAVEHDELYVNADNATTQVIEGLMDMVTMGNPMTLAMGDADPVASFVWYVAIGDDTPLWHENSPWPDNALWSSSAWG